MRWAIRKDSPVWFAATCGRSRDFLNVDAVMLHQHIESVDGSGLRPAYLYSVRKLFFECPQIFRFHTIHAWFMLKFTKFTNRYA